MTPSRRAPLLACLALWLAGPARAQVGAAGWRAAGFSDVTVTELSLDAYYAGAPRFEAAGALELRLLLLRGSGWTEGQARDLVAQVADVYSQCGVRLSRAELVEAVAPGGRTRFSKYDAASPDSLNALARLVPSGPKPLLYLFAGFTDAADDAAFSRADFDEPPSPADGPRDPALFDSAFLPAGLNSPAYRAEHGAYSTAAHELWHVLTREGQHYDETPHHLGNIWRDRTNAITARDCRLILANPLVRRL